MALLHQSVDILGGFADRLLGHRACQNVANRISVPAGAPDQPVLGGSYRNEGDVILAVPAGGALFGKYADDP